MKAEEKKKLAYVIEIKESFENAVKEERDFMNGANENEKKLKKLKKFLSPESCEVIWEEVKEPHCAIEKEQVKPELHCGIFAMD